MKRTDILDVRDDLGHILKLLNAVQMMTEGVSIGRYEAAAISEVISVAQTSLSVADGRLAKMQEQSGGGVRLCG